MRINQLLLLLPFVVFSSCSSIDIFKENIETPIRSKYGSFVIINQELGQQSFSSPEIDEPVQRHMVEALEAAGMLYDKEKPELVIRYTSNEVAREREATQNYASSPYWGYRVWDPWSYNPYYNNRNNNSTSNYELVQVIVDFIDQKEDKLLMTLTGVTEVSSPKTKSKRVLKTTDKVMEYFLYEIREK